MTNRFDALAAMVLTALLWAVACDNGDATTPKDTTLGNDIAADGGDGSLDTTGVDAGDDTVANCGDGCGANATCTNGACECDENFDDCNFDPDDGCEIALQTDSDCLSCADSCNGAKNVTGSACTPTGCTWTDCLSGFADCDTNLRNGCEVELATDVNHCGVCDAACTFTNSTGECADNACVITACEALSFDIDEMASNGCELLLTEVFNEHLTRQFDPVNGPGTDQLGMRGGSPPEVVYDVDKGVNVNAMGYFKGSGESLLLDLALGISDLHVTPSLGVTEPMAFMTSSSTLKAVGLGERPLVETASAKPLGDMQATRAYAVKSLGLPVGLRNGQMVAIAAPNTSFAQGGLLQWYQVAKSGDPEFGQGARCSPTSATGIQLCHAGSIESGLPGIQDLDILPLFNAAGDAWTPLIIAAGNGEVVFAEPIFSASPTEPLTTRLAQVTINATGAPPAIPADVIDVVAIPGDDGVESGFAVLSQDAIKVYRFAQSAPGARPSSYRLVDSYSAQNTPIGSVVFVDAEVVDSTKLLVSSRASNGFFIVVTEELSGNPRLEVLNEDVGTSYYELEYARESGQLAIFHGRAIEMWSLEFTE